MNSLADYSSATSSWELLVHLFDRIQTGELATFDALQAYVAGLPEKARSKAILKRAFDFQRQLRWGFFKDLCPEVYPRIWKEVVLPDREVPGCGDLKRLMSLSDIYLGLLDIHGYTRFCQEFRHNLSMLDLLDKMIQEDIFSICAKGGVLSRRANGDEILLLGASAADVLVVIMRIMEYFAQRRRIHEPDGPTLPVALRDFTLPEFQISAGMAGGQKFTTLVITQDGDLSGDIVNTAARLQARANRISPTRNKILVTSHVCQKLKNHSQPELAETLARIEFLNTGTIDFKGISLMVHDIIILPDESHRLGYKDLMEELFEALEKGMWKSRVLESAIALASRLVANTPEAAFGRREKGGNHSVSKNHLNAKILMSRKYFEDEEFEKAIQTFAYVVDELAELPSTDLVGLEYLRNIQANYRIILREFEAHLDNELERRKTELFAPREQAYFDAVKQHFLQFDSVRNNARLRIRNRKQIWYQIIENASRDLSTSFKSPK